MTRKIKITQIADHMGTEVQQLVVATTLEWEARVKARTPTVTGVLKNGWQHDIKPFLGEITNPVEYAEPVCFGTNLPPSWKGEPKSSPPPGFPELIGKELEAWSQVQYRRIVARD